MVQQLNMISYETFKLIKRSDTDHFFNDRFVVKQRDQCLIELTKAPCIDLVDSDRQDDPDPVPTPFDPFWTDHDSYTGLYCVQFQ